MSTSFSTARALSPSIFSQSGAAVPAKSRASAVDGGKESVTSGEVAYTLALPAACWILRISIAIMCWGLAAKVLFIPLSAETDIFELLLFDQVGQGVLVDGEWSEAQAKAVDHNGAWYYFMAGLALLVAPAVVAGMHLVPPLAGVAEFARRWGLLWQVPLLLAISLWTLLIAGSHVYRGGDFMSEATVFAYCARIVTPLGLIFWLAATARPRDLPHTFGQTANAWVGEQILRWGIGITFFVHGLEAYFHNPHFIDLIILTDQAYFGWGIRQPLAEQMLTVIGIVDIVLAVAIITRRFRSVALWMVFWGTLTACSRVTAEGWGKYPEILMRAAHAGAPLALFVYWQWGLPRSKQPTSHTSPAEEPTS